MTTQTTARDRALSFWQHLDELRAVLIRALVVVVLAAAAAFVLKDELFRLVLAPRSADFITYRLMGAEASDLHLMNTELTEQFMIHVRTALCAGLLLASPYVLFELFRYVSPALYDSERRVATTVAVAAYAMFLLGTVVNYLLVFPLTLRFLGTYQVSPDVENMLTLQSYVDTLLGMTFVMGLVFELPVVSALLAWMGLTSAGAMAAYRRHAIVAILFVAAIITPTTDVVTLFVVALPIYMLYEASIVIIRLTKH